LFELTSGERGFLDGVLDRGEIQTSGLSGDPDLAERISDMPMLAWKSRNVRTHRGGEP
jgi:hypothetical protein